MALFKTSTAYDQFLEYLATKVTPADILAFQAAPQDQERLNALTEKNKTGVLTPDESAELDEMLAFNRLMTLLKTRAYVAIKQDSA
jgi:hypothetical protein